jgi:hypothetical protein
MSHTRHDPSKCCGGTCRPGLPKMDLNFEAEQKALLDDATYLAELKRMNEDPELFKKQYQQTWPPVARTERPDPHDCKSERPDDMPVASDPPYPSVISDKHRADLFGAPGWQPPMYTLTVENALPYIGADVVYMNANDDPRAAKIVAIRENNVDLCVFKTPEDMKGGYGGPTDNPTVVVERIEYQTSGQRGTWCWRTDRP